jgi:hypothetical protein
MIQIRKLRKKVKGVNTNPKSEETKEKMRVARLAYLAKRKGGDV